MKKGYWIILDELNLAPSEAIELLNSLLDDNKEIFIPETQETIKAHPNFRIFATQNPVYGYEGRKKLSNALLNRFIRIDFDFIPSNELSIILEKRCNLPLSLSKKLVAVMNILQVIVSTQFVIFQP